MKTLLLNKLFQSDKAALLTAVGVTLTVMVVYFPMAFLGTGVIGPADIAYGAYPWRADYYSPNQAVLSDEADLFIPMVASAHAYLRNGDLPLFMPDHLNGIPVQFVANSDVNSIPLMLSTLTFGVPIGINVWLIGRALFAAYCTFQLLRVWKLGREAAIVGTITFMFSSFAVQRFVQSFFLIYALIPVLLYGIERILQNRSKAWCLGLPLAGYMLVSAGYPHMSIVVALFVSGYTLLRLMERRCLTDVYILSGIVVLTVAMAMPVLLATYDYFYGGFDWTYRANRWTNRLQSESLVSLAVPEVLLNRRSSDSWIRNATYIGVLPLIMACVSIFLIAWKRHSFWYLTAVVFVLPLALYNLSGFNQYVWKRLPVLGSVAPNTLILLWMASMSLMSAFGVDAWLSADCGTKRRVATLAALVVALVGFGVFAWPVVAAAAEIESKVAVVACVRALVVVFVVGVMAWSIRRGQSGTRWLAPASVVVVLVDLGAMGYDWNDTTPVSRFYPETAGVKYLLEHQGDCKVLPTGTALHSRMASAVGIRALGVRGFPSSRIKQLYQAISDDAFRVHPTQTLLSVAHPDHGGVRLNAPLIDSLGIRYVATPPDAVLWGDRSSELQGYSLVYDDDIRIWENSEALERGYIVPRVSVTSNSIERLIDPSVRAANQAFIDDSDSSDSALLELVEKNGLPLDGSVTPFELGGYRQQFDVTASRPAMLVVSDNFHSGWVARIGSVKVPLWRVNGNMRGLPVPRGASEVTLTYEPAGLWPAMYLSSSVAGGLLFTLIGRAMMWFLQRQRAQAEPVHLSVSATGADVPSHALASRQTELSRRRAG